MIKPNWLVMFCLLLAPIQGMGVELYKWTDEYGRIHYSDEPPGNGNVEKMEIKVKSCDGPAQALNYTVEFNPDPSVKIYSAEWCGVCKRTKQYMQERSIKFKELDIDKNRTAKREFKKINIPAASGQDIIPKFNYSIAASCGGLNPQRLNGRDVPVILAGRQRMNGFSPAKLESMLEAVRPGR